MKRLKTYLATLLGCLISLTVFAHPFYVSISSVDYNSSKKRLEIACRLFYDDLEVALKTHQQKKLDVLNPKEKAVLDSAISRYIKANFKLQVNGQAKEMKYVGYEVEEDVAWCYFEVPQANPVQRISIVNQLLYQDFKSQSNIMHVTVSGKRKSSKLDNPKRMVEFSF